MKAKNPSSIQNIFSNSKKSLRDKNTQLQHLSTFFFKFFDNKIMIKIKV